MRGLSRWRRKWTKAPKASVGADSTALVADASISRAVAYSRSLQTDTPSVHAMADPIAFVEDAPMARTGAVSVTFEVEAPSVCAGRSSMTFAMDAHGWAVPVALDVAALMAHAGADRIAFQVDSPTTRAEAVILKASAMYAPATYVGADLLSRVVVTSSGSDPERLVFDAPRNRPRVERVRRQCMHFTSLQLPRARTGRYRGSLFPATSHRH